MAQKDLWQPASKMVHTHAFGLPFPCFYQGLINFFQVYLVERGFISFCSTEPLDAPSTMSWLWYLTSCCWPHTHTPSFPKRTPSQGYRVNNSLLPPSHSLFYSFMFISPESQSDVYLVSQVIHYMSRYLPLPSRPKELQKKIFSFSIILYVCVLFLWRRR